MGEEVVSQESAENVEKPAQQDGTQSKQYEASRAVETSKPKRKKTSPALKVLLWIVLIVMVIIIGLAISAYIAGFNSILEMMDWIVAEIARMT